VPGQRVGFAAPLCAMAPTGTAVAFQIGTGKKGKGLEDGCRVLKQPRGLHACRDGSILVADYGNHCVLRFRPGDGKGAVVAGEEGKKLPDIDPLKDIDKPLALPEEEGRWLKLPCDVCEDPARGILVLDTDDGCVQRFCGDGPAQTLIPQGGKSTHRSMGAPQTVKNPRAFTVAPDGALLLCDSWSHRVLRFPSPEGPDAAEQPTVIAGTPNGWGKRPDQLAFPSSVVVQRDGAVLVADTNNHRIQRFVPGSDEATTVAGSATGQRGNGLSELDMPTGLCLDPQDASILVADRANGRVLRFPADSRAGTEGAIVAGPDVMSRPWGVCVTGDGAVYVSDERKAVVLKLEVDGNAAAVPPARAPAATELAPPPPAEPAPQLSPLDLD